MSRPDVAKLAEDIARAREEQAAAEALAAMVDPLRESRLLVGMILHPWVLALCEEVEVEDFHDFRHRAALALLRELQHEAGEVDPYELLRRIEDLRVLVHVATAIAERAPFVGERCVLEYAAHLRRLADRRRAQ